MNRNRLLITEDERKYILSMYGIIREQNQDPPEKLDIKSSDFFDSGYYSKLKNEASLNAELEKAVEFLKQNRTSATSIKILASEDNNPNWDNEKNVDLDTGELAELRAKTIKNYLINFFNQKLKAGEISAMPIFEEPETIVGTGVTSKEKEFDRRIEINFSVVKKPYIPQPDPELPKSACSKNMKIRIFYDKETHGGHNCNSAIFEVDINGVPMVRDVDGASYVSLNNAGVLDNKGYVIENKTILISNKNFTKTTKKIVYLPISKSPGGTNREDYITITDSLFKSIPNVNNELRISFTCRNLSRYIKDPEALYNYFKEIPKYEWHTGTTMIPSGYVYLGGVEKENKINVDPKQILYQGTQFSYISNNWYHASQWGFNCHDGVGGIQLINENGEVGEPITIRTPKMINERKYMGSMNPCTLKEIKK
jgi:hypothetical protein